MGHWQHAAQGGAWMNVHAQAGYAVHARTCTFYSYMLHGHSPAGYEISSSTCYLRIEHCIHSTSAPLHRSLRQAASAAYALHAAHAAHNSRQLRYVHHDKEGVSNMHRVILMVPRRPRTGSTWTRGPTMMWKWGRRLAAIRITLPMPVPGPAPSVGHLIQIALT